MSYYRLSTSSLSDQSIYYLHQNQYLMAKLQERVSTGKNINRPSDDPLGLTRVLDISDDLSQDNRYDRNLDAALGELNTVDGFLQNMTSVIQRARELGVQGVNGTNSQAQRDAVAQEIDSAIKQLVQLGNSRLAGRSLFSGFRVTDDPFVGAGDDVTYVGTPPAEPYQRTLEVAPGVVVGININGESLLGTVTTAPGNVVTGGAGIIRRLTELRYDLLNGDPTTARTRLDQIDVELNTILSEHSRIGAITNRLEMTQERIADRKALLSKEYADVQDIDMAKTITDLKYQESVFQSSLGVTARVLQPSLLSYL